MARLAPRIKRHKNGNATLSGVPHHMLRLILDMAAINYFENPEGLDADMPTFGPMLRRLTGHSRYQHGFEFVPVTQLGPTGLWCRKRAVLEARKERIALERIFEKWRSLHAS